MICTGIKDGRAFFVVVGDDPKACKFFYDGSDLVGSEVGFLKVPEKSELRLQMLNPG